MKETIRAIVMLLVLVGLPTAWIYYGPLPPNAQGVVDRVVQAVKDATGWQQPHEALVETKVAPRFAGQSPPEVAPRVLVSALQVTTSAAAYEAPATQPADLKQELAPLLVELQSLGPADYSLEAWGNSGEFFRFQCSMPLGGHEGFCQQFEAVSPRPAESVRQVTAEIAEWKQSRSSNRADSQRIASHMSSSR